MKSIDSDVGEEVDDGETGASRLTSVALFASAAMAFSGALKEVPPFLFSPIDLTLLTTLLAFALALWVAIVRGVIPAGRPLTVFLLLVALAAVGSINYVSTDYGIQKYTRLFIVTLPAAATVWLLIRDHVDFHRFIRMLLGLAVLQSLWINIGGVRQFGSGRLVTTEGTTISFGRAAGFVVVGVVAWAISSNRVTPTRLALAGAVAGFHVWTTFAVASRGPLLGVAVGVLAIVALQARRLQVRQGVRLLALLALLVTAISVVWVQIPEDSRERIFDMEDGSADSRTLAWSYTWDRLSASPEGSGWGSWDLDATVDLVYPHNIVLEVWFEAGVLGLVALLAALWISIRHQDRVFAVNRLYGTVGFATLLYWLTTAQVSGELNDNKVLIMLLVAGAAPLSSALDPDEPDDWDAQGILAEPSTA